MPITVVAKAIKAPWFKKKTPTRTRARAHTHYIVTTKYIDLTVTIDAH